MLLLLFVMPMGTMAIAQQGNQVGFLSKSIKHLFFPEDKEHKEFNVYKGAKLVLSGNTNEAKYWDCAGESVVLVDVSELSKEGNYYVEIDSCIIDFSIDEKSYENIGISLAKTFYLARASVDIEARYAGQWKRMAGHPDNKILIHSSAADENRKEGDVISSPGGWYDAGDYNKYIVNSGISTYTLLHLVDNFGKQLKNTSLNIPESSNKTPDVLDEAIYNLRWMLTMQNPHDGGVYHKLTSKRFCGMIMPDRDKSERYVVMKTTSSTLDFVATMAKAYRVLSRYEKDYPHLSDSCLEASKMAWEWTLENPNVTYQQPDDIKTGQYSDDNLLDEKFWAASEMYLSTKEDRYKDALDFDVSFGIPQWGKVSTLGLWSIVSYKGSLDEAILSSSKQKLMKLANEHYAAYDKSAYKIPITSFPWGSNSTVANQGITLMHAYSETRDKKYIKAADACVGYILGANPTGYCFVTGFGRKSPIDIHERRTVADGIEEPIPGLLVGGPSRQRQSDCGEDIYPSEYPAKSYVDLECSYSTNEIAINWNAPAVYLFLGMKHLLK